MSRLRKFGSVMWGPDSQGLMAPLKLHGLLLDDEMENLHKVYVEMVGRKDVRPTLEMIHKCKWHNIKTIKPFLIDSLQHRTSARDLIAQEIWSEFWTDLN